MDSWIFESMLGWRRTARKERRMAAVYAITGAVAVLLMFYYWVFLIVGVSHLGLAYFFWRMSLRSDNAAREYEDWIVEDETWSL